MNSKRAASHRWATAALVGLAAYVVADIVLATLRPDLSLVHNAESDYGNGPYRWLMDANFEIRLLLSLFAAAAATTACRARLVALVGVTLLVVWSSASGVLGFYPDDVEGAPTTSHGTIHLLTAAVGFIACLLGTGLLTLSAHRLFATGRVVVLGSLWLIAAVGLILLAATGFRPGTLDGLWERVFLAGELLWIATFCWTLSAARQPDHKARARSARRTV